MNGKTLSGRLVIGLLVVLATTGPLIADNFSASTTFDGVTTNTTDINIGFGVPNVTITITNGAQVFNTGRTQIGYPNAASSNEAVVVTGSSSLLTNTTVMTVGRIGAANQLTIANGGRVWSTAGFVGGQDLDDGLAPSNNTAVVTGIGSTWNTSDHLTVGRTGSGNQLIITNGGRVVSLEGFLGGNSSLDSTATSRSNTVIVTGAGSTWSNITTTGNRGIIIGSLTPYNRLIISDGGRVDAGAVIMSKASNSVTVAGNSSLYVNQYLMIGQSGTGNQLVISNGATAASVDRIIIGQSSSGGGSILVTGHDSTLRGGRLYLGQEGVEANGTGSVRVTDDGILELGNLIRVGTGGSVSNVGGVYQFTTAAPTITKVGTGTVALDGGTISYRGVNGADINDAQVGNITKSGNNTFKLDNSTNTTVSSYTFDSVANTGNPNTYQRLTLANGSRWQSTSLTVGNGGVLNGNGTVASASVTNLGTIAPGFSPGQLTFTGDLVLGASSVLATEIGGPSLSNYDQLVVGGNVTVTGTLAIAMIDSFSPTPGDTFTLIDNQGANPISGLFNGLTNNAFIDASANGVDAFFRIRYDGGTGNDLVLTATIPEPSIVTFWMIAGGLFFCRKRRT